METIEQEIGINNRPGISRREVIWAAISYLGVLVLLPYSLKKRGSFLDHHLRQGLSLFGAEIFFTFIVIIPFVGWLISFLGWFLCGIFSLFGFIEALRKRYWPLPILPKFLKILERGRIKFL